MQNNMHSPASPSHLKQYSASPDAWEEERGTNLLNFNSNPNIACNNLESSLNKSFFIFCSSLIWSSSTKFVETPKRRIDSTFYVTKTSLFNRKKNCRNLSLVFKVEIPTLKRHYFAKNLSLIWTTKWSGISTKIQSKESIFGTKNYQLKTSMRLKSNV